MSTQSNPAKTNAKPEDQPEFKAQFLHPKYWGIWLVFAMVLPLIYLPLRWQFGIGKVLGLLCFKLIKRRRHDTLVNLALCFPEKTDVERYDMAREVFINAGIGIFETLCAWFRPSVFPTEITIDGLDALETARAEGKAILLLGGHFTLLDLGGVLFTRYAPADAVYRPQNNPLLDWFIRTGRRNIFQKQIAFRDTRGLARSLKDGRIVWYSPDQDFGLDHGIMAPFFGVNAASITAARRLARIGDTVVMAVGFHRLGTLKNSNQPHYHVTIVPPLENYPSKDELTDATRVNQIIETMIRTEPAQYMWFHRRFKTQADGTDYYKKTDKQVEH